MKPAPRSPPAGGGGRSRKAFTGAVFAFLGAGLLALLYHLYDLKCPSHFVGDMYGIEVLFRLLVLLTTAGAMLLGAVLLALGRIRGSKPLETAGSLLVVTLSLVLLALSLGIVRERHKDALRGSYPEKSVEELIHLARSEKEWQAIDALVLKNDPAAVRPLCKMLLESNEDARLHYSAVRALAHFGGEEALAALEQARSMYHGEYYRTTIDYALEELRRKGGQQQ